MLVSLGTSRCRRRWKEGAQAAGQEQEKWALPAARLGWREQLRAGLAGEKTWAAELGSEVQAGGCGGYEGKAPSPRIPHSCRLAAVPPTWSRA